MEKVERRNCDSCGGDLWEGEAAKETELDELRDIAKDGGKKSMQKHES